MAKLPDIQDAITVNEHLRQIPVHREKLEYALRRARRQLAEAREEHDETVILRTLGYLADVARISGELDEAEEAAQEALALATESGKLNARIANTLRLAEVYRYREELDAAGPLFQEAIELANNDADNPMLHHAFQQYGQWLIDSGRFTPAHAVLSQALTLREKLGNDDLIAESRNAMELANALALAEKRRA